MFTIAIEIFAALFIIDKCVPAIENGAVTDNSLFDKSLYDFYAFSSSGIADKSFLR